VVVALAPTVHADTTMTAADICNAVKPGYVPVIPVAQNFGACAASPAMAGVFYMPTTIKGWMDGHRHGSYPVDPGNPFSDWIVPAGAGAAPPGSDPPYMWQKDPGVWQGPCPPICP
jgi:hypothetical protein